ncbi:MAG: hemin uptake protein HemP [Rhodospirillaceae bacterium]
MKELPEVPRSERLAKPAKPSGEDTKREVRSEDLFNGSSVVLIRHADVIYTLRRTSSGKLILTK